jgi:hypothetical protein
MNGRLSAMRSGQIALGKAALRSHSPSYFVVRFLSAHGGDSLADH